MVGWLSNSPSLSLTTFSSGDMDVRRTLKALRGRSCQNLTHTQNVFYSRTTMHTHKKRVLLTHNDSHTHSVRFANTRHHSQTSAFCFRSKYSMFYTYKETYFLIYKKISKKQFYNYENLSPVLCYAFSFI